MRDFANSAVSATTAASADRIRSRWSARVKARAINSRFESTKFEGDLDDRFVVEIGRQDDGVGKFLAEVGEGAGVGVGTG